MAKKKKSRGQEEPRELTRKEVHLNARDRKRNRTVTLIVGGVIGAVVLILLIGLINEFLVKPNSAVATVGDDKIITKEYRQRLYLEENQLENRFLQLQQLEQQFGGQNIFTSQLSQIQATLSSPFALGIDVLDKMIEEKLIEQEAAVRGIVVSEEEISEALRDEIAAGQGAVTEPQATSTAAAAASATEVAAAWTPTPTPTVDASQPLTASESVDLEPEAVPTLPLLTDASYQEGLEALESSLQEIAGLSVNDYRQLLATRLLAQKVSDVVSQETVVATEEEVRARHILISEITPPEPLPAADETDEETADADAATQEANSDTAASETSETTDSPVEEPASRTLDEARALAEELRQRIQDGEDFAALAAEYSDDLSNAADGGDLGWFGRGRMVAPFEEAAFALAVGEVSEPVETQFGFHLIEVLERDDARPKDENTLAQEESQAFQSWLQEQLTNAEIERADDLTSKIPNDVATGAIFSSGIPQAPQAPQVPQVPTP